MYAFKMCCCILLYNREYDELLKHGKTSLVVRWRVEINRDIRVLGLL